MKVGLTLGVKGEYKFIRRKAVTDDFGNRVPGPITQETPWMRNLMTNTYFNNALTIQTLSVRGISVGSGNTAPAESQTILTNFIAATTSRQKYTNTINSSVSPRYVRKEFTYRFAEGAAAGNIAEVGMFDSVSTGATSATVLSSRALVVDGGGSPTVVTVLSDEFLDVVWRGTWYVPEDVAGSCSLTIDGTPTVFNWTIRATSLGSGSTPYIYWSDETIGFCPNGGYINSGPGWSPQLTNESVLRSYTDMGDGTETSGNVLSTWTGDAYTTNSKTRTFRFTWGLTQANITFKSIIFQHIVNDGRAHSLGRFQILLSNTIAKVNTKTMLFILRMTMANVP